MQRPSHASVLLFGCRDVGPASILSHHVGGQGNMRLLIFSDLHRDRAAARSVVERAAAVDLVIGAGDFAVQRGGIEDVIDILLEI